MAMQATSRSRNKPRDGGAKLPRDDTPISSSEASYLFAGLTKAPAVVLAVSGGPDSTALLWLAASWRKRLRSGPKLVAVTIDHGLRKEAAAEARAVKKLAASLGIAHTTMRWSGAKPSRGIPAAARDARYELLASAARKAGAVCILTAHTLDDQAETFLMRLSRGSGLAGLAAMARYSLRGHVAIGRPLLNVAKARLIATLDKAGISYASDPTNQDTTFTRPRWRKLMPELAQEGIDARNIARLVVRLARANEALDAVADRAEAALVRVDGSRQTIDAKGFLTLPDEVMLRLLHRAIDRAGYEGPAELGKVEILLSNVVGALATNKKFRRTLAGALIDAGRGAIGIAPAPPRRKSRS
jgi:tRNA(Ile)-lysidine synthase